MAIQSAAYPEALLQYAWQHRRYDTTNLLTTDRQPVTVVRPGQWNSAAGPDFLQATVRIGKLEFHGHVELHVRGDDWRTHGHATDPAYAPVILHVVGKESQQLPLRNDGTAIPELVIGDRLHAELLRYYAKLAQSDSTIACAAFFPTTEEVPRRMWVESLGHRRLLAKADTQRANWAAEANDWRQALWITVAGALAGPQNRLAFETVAHRVTYGMAATHREQPLALEALLLGAAGLLESPQDEFSEELARHWHHYQRLHRVEVLSPGSLTQGRMRPAAFPSLRLAQWAALARHSSDWLRLLTASVPELRTFLSAGAHPYFESHYRLGVPSRKHSAVLGRQLVHHLLINTLVPFAVFYHRQRGDSTALEIAVERLTFLPPETNRITALYAQLGYQPRHALDTQGLLELHRHYCTPKNCLQCAIGHGILKRSY